MRLIDADALIEGMDKRYKEKQDIVLDNLAEGFMQMEKLIKEQPTAFNLDAVVAQLDKKEIECFKNGSMGYLFPVYGEAKDIVRNGGKE